MVKINELFSRENSGITIKLFEYDIDDDISYNELKEYLIQKVRGSKAHSITAEGILPYVTPEMDTNFIARLNQKITQLMTPAAHGIPHFDVRRERVTEWMAQLLLEQKYDCIFYDAADKRMNIEPVNLDKHTPGIDVPGLKIVEDEIKFVVCEVKASEANVPATSVADSLNQDIQNSIDSNSRVSTEILQYITSIRKNIENEDLQKVIIFLTKLINLSGSDLMNNILFFPIMIRKCEAIVAENNVSDFDNFSVRGIDKKSIENILVSFKKSFLDFSQEIYEEAIVHD